VEKDMLESNEDKLIGPVKLIAKFQQAGQDKGIHAVIKNSQVNKKLMSALSEIALSHRRSG
jgi:hypothetical protein